MDEAEGTAGSCVDLLQGPGQAHVVTVVFDAVARRFLQHRAGDIDTDADFRDFGQRDQRPADAAAEVEGALRGNLTEVPAAGGESFLDMPAAGAEELLQRFRGELALAIALLGQNPEVWILLSPGLPLSIADHRCGAGGAGVYRR